MNSLIRGMSVLPDNVDSIKIFFPDSTARCNRSKKFLPALILTEDGSSGAISKAMSTALMYK